MCTPCFRLHLTGDEPGPDTELEYWRQRMAKLNSLAEQLKTREARVVMGTCQIMRSPSSKRWKVGRAGLELKNRAAVCNFQCFGAGAWHEMVHFAQTQLKIVSHVHLASPAGTGAARH